LLTKKQYAGINNELPRVIIFLLAICYKSFQLPCILSARSSHLEPVTGRRLSEI